MPVVVATSYLGKAGENKKSIRNQLVNLAILRGILANLKLAVGNLLKRPISLYIYIYICMYYTPSTCGTFTIQFGIERDYISN